MLYISLTNRSKKNMEIVTFDFLEKRMHMTDLQLNIFIKAELDVSAPTITVWRKNGIPADRQLEILEKIFSVDPEDIRKLTITSKKPNPNKRPGPIAYKLWII